MRSLAAALAFLASPAVAECGAADMPCELVSGSYHIETPEGAAGPVPAIVFLHGAGGKGTGILRMGGPILERGYAVIGPNGLDRPNSRFGTGWSFHPQREKRRDELAFMRAVIDDAVANHGIDRDRILLAGFSIGGSMTSYLACDAPDLARAYAPVAGSFWRPHPAMDACQGPVDLLHTHGWRDTTVPLEGRPLRSGVIYQGDVFQAMQIWRTTNGCKNMRADAFDTSGEFWRRSWDSCDAGSLEFVMHPGAHGIPKGWSTIALDWFETLD
ncbi:alpha/beta hydrolase family esterase [Litoreibacter janthinus]|uniref:Polyhydroxybutyrate depolymerase n=1 Tax=Litoreibacter janthinus TaxID=670154 RepID=A0A1I6GY97_9RHOB|nr:alpha/beta fold hydrolase [Litoreibacter janthinus]SFR47140.1 polyhydroxybutyrate depolymerase [Litoreibacter janthinus]